MKPDREHFVGVFTRALRALLPQVSGPEAKVLLAVISHVDQRGMGWPGVRRLSELTHFNIESVGQMLCSLEGKGILVCLRKSEPDPLTGRMMPDVWAVSPELVLAEDHILATRGIRHSSIPDSALRENPAQADRLTELNTGNQTQRSRLSEADSGSRTGLAGAVSSQPHRQMAAPQAIGVHLSEILQGAQDGISLVRTAPQGSSAAIQAPPGSATPPLSLGALSFISSLRKRLPALSGETAQKLVVQYGVEQVAGALGSLEAQNEKRRQRGEEEIKRPVGWIIRNLEAGANERARRTG